MLMLSPLLTNYKLDNLVNEIFELNNFTASNHALWLTDFIIIGTPTTEILSLTFSHVL